jgi:hypothetical protein
MIARVDRKVRASAGRSHVMKYRSHPVAEETSADPYSGSSLVPMLVAGLALTLVGMIAVALLM